MKVYVVTKADLDCLVDTSMREIFIETLCAPLIFATGEAARKWVQQDVNEIWEDLDLGEAPHLAASWEQDPLFPDFVTAVVLDGELVYRISLVEVGEG
jgi:hypothetical protein